MRRRRTLLLFGATGFLGSHLADAAEAAGLRVVPSPSRPGFDIRSAEQVEAAVRDAKPAMIANLTGLASVQRSWDHPREAYEVNALGSLNVVRAAAGAVRDARVLLASSAEVYGRVDPALAPLVEDAPLAPLTPYGASKAAMEILCEREGRERGVDVAFVRAFNQIGPGQSAAHAASGFARQIAEAEAEGRTSVALSVGNLASTRDFTDVRDAAAALVALLTEGGRGPYNLCSERATPLRAVVDALAAATGLHVSTVTAPHLMRSVDPPVTLGSGARLRTELGWKPGIPLRQSMADLLDWWRRELLATAS